MSKTIQEKLEYSDEEAKAYFDMLSRGTYAKSDLLKTAQELYGVSEEEGKRILEDYDKIKNLTKVEEKPKTSSLKNKSNRTTLLEYVITLPIYAIIAGAIGFGIGYYAGLISSSDAEEVLKSARVCSGVISAFGLLGGLEVLSNANNPNS